MTNAAARNFLILCLQGFYQPRSNLSPWAWHEQQETLLETEESQDYPGPYDSSFAPQNRFFMEFASGTFSENIEFLPGFENVAWREFIIKKSSQVGVTLSVLLVIVWWIAERRKNVIYAINSEQEVARISNARLQPLIKNCPGARSRIHAGEEGMNTLTLSLMGLVIYLLGGHAEGGFQNKSASLGIIDEADFHPPPAPGKSNNVEELRTRLKAVDDAKIYVVSKPKTEEHVTHKEHKRGTQHVCLVPCPHCDHYQELVLANLRYDYKDLGGEYDLDRIRAEAHFECEFCHKKIEQHHKRAMMVRHKWRQTNPKPAPRILSAHESDFYSPFPTANWGVIAVEYVQALKSIAAMTTFRRDRLGLAERLQTSVLEAKDVERLRFPYPRGTCPVDACLVAMGGDVQGDVRPWVKGAFTLTGELYIIDWGMTLAIDELSDEAAEPVPIGMPMDYVPRGRSWTEGRKELEWAGKAVRVEQGIIDEGHIHMEVRRFCVRTNGLFVASKGRGGVQVRRTVVESEGECDGEEFITYHFDDDAFKKQLYIDRIGNFDKILAGKSRVPRMYLPWQLDAEFVDQLTSEKLGTKIDRMGFAREEWKKDPGIPNDYGDALKQLLVIWYWMSPIILAEHAAQKAAEPSEGEQAA